MLMTLLLSNEECIMVELDLVHKRLNLKLDKASTLSKHV